MMKLARDAEAGHAHHDDPDDNVTSYAAYPDAEYEYAII